MKIVALSSLLLLTGTAFADCPERLQRSPDFVALATDENAPKPKGSDDFKFIDDTTTFEGLQTKVGPPNASKSAHRFLWCLPDGKVVEVETRTGSDIRTVRVDGKTVYKRK